MSRRNNARRRRTYGRRQHEVRQRHNGRSLEIVGDWFVPADELGEQVDERHAFDMFDGDHRGRAVA